MRKVRIIGAGFSGLSLAYYLSKKNVPVEIFEKSDAPGGLLATHKESWGLVEQAANGILNSRDVEDLFDELKITPVWPSRKNKARYIYKNGTLTQWPLGLFDSFRFAGNAFQYFLRDENKQPTENETLESFISRNFGQYTFDYLVAPAMRGIYGTENLSAELLYQNFVTRNTRKGSRSGTVSCMGGMGEVCSKIVQVLESQDIRVQYSTVGEIDPRHLNVLAVDAHSASVLLTPYDMKSAQRLQHVQYQPLTSVTIGLKENSRTKKGFGALFPPKEKFNSLGVLFNTDLFEGRGPLTTETWMFQGADLSEREYLEKVIADRARLVGKNDQVENFKVFSHPHGIPVYNQNLFDALGEMAVPEYVILHGNYLGGIGLQKILTRSSILSHEIASEFGTIEVSE